MKLPSSVRPKSGSGAADTLNPARWPVDNFAGVINAPASPEEPLGELSCLVHEVLGLK